MTEVSPVSMLTRLQEVVKDHPPTITRGQEYVWQDQNESTNQVTTSWAVAVYGKAGDTVDNVRKAVVDFILANSSYDSTNWSKVLPDLFSPDEYIIIPNWNSYSVPFQELEDGIHSPIMRPMEMLEMAKEWTPEYSVSHIDGNANFVPSLWRSIALVITGNPKPEEGESSQFIDRYPDFFLTSTGSIDFMRMTQPTQQMAYMLHDLLTVAETMDDLSQVPSIYSRTVRNDKTFVTGKLNGVMYHVLSKQSMTAMEIAPILP